MLAATLAAFPPYRLNGDEATVQRIIRRPNSALEVGGGGAEGCQSCWAGVKLRSVVRRGLLAGCLHALPLTALTSRLAPLRLGAGGCARPG